MIVFLKRLIFDCFCILMTLIISRNNKRYNMKKIMLRADDLGFSKAVNYGIYGSSTVVKS